MIEAMKLALEALIIVRFCVPPAQRKTVNEAIKAIEEALAKQEQGEPVAVVTGMYGGQFIVEPTNPAMVLPVNIALYTRPQPRTWIDLTGEELETLLRENRLLALGAIWAVADKLKEKNNG